MNAAALAAIVALSWGAINTPVFHANDIRVTGAKRLGAAEVLRLGGVGSTTNVLRTSPSSVERRLESSPWIAEATVTRELPATLTIAVRERRATAIVRVTGRWVTLAGDATVLTTGTTKPKLPVLEGLTRLGNPEPGDSVAGARPALAVAKRVAARWRVTQVRIGDGVDLRLASGVRVRYGDATAWREKNAALRALLRWAAGQGRAPQVVDVRVPKAPTLRLVGPPIVAA